MRDDIKKRLKRLKKKKINVCGDMAIIMQSQNKF